MRGHGRRLQRPLTRKRHVSERPVVFEVPPPSVAPSLGAAPAPSAETPPPPQPVPSLPAQMALPQNGSAVLLVGAGLPLMFAPPVIVSAGAQLLPVSGPTAMPPAQSTPTPRPSSQGGQLPPALAGAGFGRGRGRTLSVLLWLFFAGSVAAAAAFAADLREGSKKEPAIVSKEVDPVLISPRWRSEGVFDWQGRTWTAVLGGCPRDCDLHAVVVKTTGCWRMVVEDGSCYIGLRNGSQLDPVPVRWALHTGTWGESEVFTDRDKRGWSIAHRDIHDNFTSLPQRLQLVVARTRGGWRAITSGGSFLVGPAVDVLPHPKGKKEGGKGPRVEAAIAMRTDQLRDERFDRVTSKRGYIVERLVGWYKATVSSSRGA